MIALFATIVSFLCGSFLTLCLYSLVIFVQYLPAISMVINNLLHGLIEFSAKVYRLILNNLMPNLVDHLPYRLFASIVISLLLCGCVTYLVYQQLVFWPFIIALLHGLAVGLGWEVSTNDALHLGKDL